MAILAVIILNYYNKSTKEKEDIQFNDIAVLNFVLNYSIIDY